MAKITSISYNDEYVIFTDDKNNSEKLAFQTPDSPDDALRVMRKEVEMRVNASRAFTSVLLQILQNPRMETYRGKTQVGQKIPPVVMSAMRECEDEYLKPHFFAILPKSMKETEKHAEWDNFISELRKPGSWNTTRSNVMKYFAHMGKLPCLYHADSPVLDKMLTLGAMDRILALAKQGAVGNTPDNSLGAKLEKLSTELDSKETTLTLEQTERALRAVAALATKLNALRTDLNSQATEHAQQLAGKAVQGAQQGAPKAQDIPVTF